MTSSISYNTSINQLPVDLFQNGKDVFKTVLQDGWKLLPEEKKIELTSKFLPRELPMEEANESVDLLIEGELVNLNNIDLLDKIYFNLRINRLAPDINKSLEDIRKLKTRARRLMEKENQLCLWKSIMNSRRNLLRQSLDCGPSDPICLASKFRVGKTFCCPTVTPAITHQAILRYKLEIEEINLKVRPDKLPQYISSDDEELISSIINSQESEDARYRNLLKKYKKRKLKIRSTDLTETDSEAHLAEIISRANGLTHDSVLLVPPIPIASCPPIKKRKNTKRKKVKIKKEKKESITIENVPVVKGIEIMSRKLDLNLDSIKKEKDGKNVFDFDDDDDLLPPKSTSNTTTTPSSTSVPIVTISTTNQVLNVVTKPASCIPQPIRPNPPPPSYTTHVTLPIPRSQPTCQSFPTIYPSHEKTISKTKNKTPPPPQVTYDRPPTSFFSLIRDTFKIHAKKDLKLSLHKLEESVKERLKSLSPGLSWSHEHVQSAMNFLSYERVPVGNNTVNIGFDNDLGSPPESIPLVDYKEKNQQWQWIGAGRDHDDVLKRMSDKWFHNRDKSSSILDPSQPIPPAICPTQWIVKPASDEEKREYQEQEALRYNNPNKAFKYRLHSYDSVVGPVKGCIHGNILSSTSSSQSPNNKAREHEHLVSERPPGVTLLSLVRDAAARLPNGEGTRADICLLLKDSQFLSPTVTDNQIHTIVSGALDRLHYEKDPCVKYDVNRKVWIYLHRNRTEEDFEKLHEMSVAAAKAKRHLTKTTTSKKIQPINLNSPSTLDAPSKSPKSLLSPSSQQKIIIKKIDSPKVVSTSTSAQPKSHQTSQLPEKTAMTEQNILEILNQATSSSSAQQIPTKKKKEDVVSLPPHSQTRTRIPNVVSINPVPGMTVHPSKVMVRAPQVIRATRPSISVIPTSVVPPQANPLQQPRPIQPSLRQPTVSIQTTPGTPSGQQIVVPSSMLAQIQAARPSQVVLTAPGGKSYVMNPGSGLVVHQQGTTHPPSRFQGIKVISLPSNNQRVISVPPGHTISGQQACQLVRFISRPGGVPVGTSTSSNNGQVVQNFQPVIISTTSSLTSSQQSPAIQHLLKPSQPMTHNNDQAK